MAFFTLCRVKIITMVSRSTAKRNVESSHGFHFAFKSANSYGRLNVSQQQKTFFYEIENLLRTNFSLRQIAEVQNLQSKHLFSKHLRSYGKVNKVPTRYVLVVLIYFNVVLIYFNIHLFSKHLRSYGKVNKVPTRYVLVVLIYFNMKT